MTFTKRYDNIVNDIEIEQQFTVLSAQSNFAKLRFYINISEISIKQSNIYSLEVNCYESVKKTIETSPATKKSNSAQVKDKQISRKIKLDENNSPLIDKKYIQISHFPKKEFEEIKVINKSNYAINFIENSNNSKSERKIDDFVQESEMSPHQIAFVKVDNNLTHNQIKFKNYINSAISNLTAQNILTPVLITSTLSESKWRRIYVDFNIETNRSINDIFVEVKAFTHSQTNVGNKNASYKIAKSIKNKKRASGKFSISASKIAQKTYSINIASHDNAIQSFNIYSKSVESDEIFKFIKNVEIHNKLANFSYDVTSHQEIIRAVPLLDIHEESNAFREIIVGRKYKKRKNIVVLARLYADQKVSMEIYNIPDQNCDVKLFRRNLTESRNNKSVLVAQAFSDSDSDSLILSDTSPIFGKIVEYFVVCTTQDENEKEDYVSNYVIIKTPSSIDGLKKGINVSISNLTTNFTNTSNSVRFTISTIATDDENQRLIDLIKSQAPDVYNSLIDPVSNSELPFNDANGKLSIKDIFIHEIVRTNMTTGLQETFDYVGDGDFNDDEITQSKSGVTRIDIGHNYTYQIYTYSKNPIEIFKKYIATKIINGKSINYLPVKWLNPRINEGYLYPDDAEGFPVITNNELLQTNFYGITATASVKGVIDSFDVSNVQITRIDKENIAITWKTISNIEDTNIYPYNYFYVVRNTNGNKQIIGCVSKNEFYDNIAGIIGFVKYSIVPITIDGYFDNAAHSNEYEIT